MGPFDPSKGRQCVLARESFGDPTLEFQPLILSAHQGGSVYHFYSYDPTGQQLDLLFSLI